MRWISELYFKVNSRREYTWLAHGLVAVAFAPVVGAWAMMVAYMFREGGQVVDSLMWDSEQDWLDHFMDVALMFVMLGLASLTGWGM